MDKFDKRTMVDDFIDEQGIVVEFPGDIEDEMVALVKFAQTCLEDAEQAEAANARLRAIIKKCEWTNVPLQLEDEPDYEDWCPWCLFGPEHDEDCELKAELAGAP